MKTIFYSFNYIFQKIPKKATTTLILWPFNFHIKQLPSFLPLPTISLIIISINCSSSNSIHQFPNHFRHLCERTIAIFFIYLPTPNDQLNFHRLQRELKGIESHWKWKLSSLESSPTITRNCTKSKSIDGGVATNHMMIVSLPHGHAAATYLYAGMDGWQIVYNPKNGNGGTRARDNWFNEGSMQPSHPEQRGASECPFPSALAVQ